MNFLILSILAFSIGAALADNDNSTSLFKTCHFQAQGAAEQAASASNNLAFQLYQKIVSANPSKNIIFSPVSISLALALLETGASGSTLRELQTALRPSGSNDLDSSKLYQALQAQLHASTVDDYKINVANGLFYADKLKLKTDYAEKLKKCFHTEITKAPFEKDTEGARKQINNWISNATNAKIPELFKGGSITPDIVAVIANAIYFKGAWDDKFTNTEDREFYKFGKTNDTQKVTFLARNAEYRYASMRNADVVEIPYQGHLFNMYVILPKQRDGIQQVEKNITGQTLTSLQFEDRQVDLKLPKFTTRLSFDLKKLLQQVGQQEIFSDQADFSRLSETPLKVSSAVHEAYIKVNENGTEAAAATGFKMVPLMARPPLSRVTFVADRPFIFAITHAPSKAIIFMGKISFVEDKEN